MKARWKTATPPDPHMAMTGHYTLNRSSTRVSSRRASFSSRLTIATGRWRELGTAAARVLTSLSCHQPVSRTKKIKDRNAVFSPVRMRGGRSSCGVSGDGPGSLTVATRYPADVKALIIA